ncbi:hypothetical protein EON68_01125 [archaeon]|nr:MAG: hypothetical protein EON68_01125 [archaeon]
MDSQLEQQREALILRLHPLACKEARTAMEDATLADGVAQLLDRYGPDCPERAELRRAYFEFTQATLIPAHLHFLLAIGLLDDDRGCVHDAGGSGGTACSLCGAHATLFRSLLPALWARVSSECMFSPETVDKLRIVLARLRQTPSAHPELLRLEAVLASVRGAAEAMDVAASTAQAQLATLAQILSPPQFFRWCAWMLSPAGLKLEGSMIAPFTTLRTAPPPPVA